MVPSVKVKLWLVFLMVICVPLAVALLLFGQQKQVTSGAVPAGKKWLLWSEGTKLRGANIWQRKVVPDLDHEFLGYEYIGPPYTQDDFMALSRAGANYVNLSIPGIFTEKPPYQLDQQALAHLDTLLDMADKADLFVVISYRTGPGRSDFTFYRDGAGNWFDKALLIETVWQSREAQKAWAAMWQFTAERYKNYKHIAGYDLMCEPNPEDILFGIYDPAEYYPKYTGAIHDWNQFYPNMITAIRAKDTETPILVSCSGWGNPSWLSSLRLVKENYAVASFHQYEPHEYTHQEPNTKIAYPGKFDINEDGSIDIFNKAWLETFFERIATFHKTARVPLACNEYGIHRFSPGAEKFIDDELAFMEKIGINHAVWMWYPTWNEWKDNAEINDFNFRMVAHASSTKVADNALYSVIKKYWAKNTVRPSTW